MACKFTLSIVHLEKTTGGTPSGVVGKVHWRMTAQDGDDKAEEYGDVLLPAPDPDAEFIAFEDLTEAQVKKWTTSAISAGRMAAMKARLIGRIEQARAPAVVTVTPPWIKPATEEGASE